MNHYADVALKINKLVWGVGMVGYIQYLKNPTSDISQLPFEIKLSPIMMNVCSLRETPCLEHLLGLKLSTDFK